MTPLGRRALRASLEELTADKELVPKELPVRRRIKTRSKPAPKPVKAKTKVVEPEDISLEEDLPVFEVPPEKSAAAPKQTKHAKQQSLSDQQLTDKPASQTRRARPGRPRVLPVLPKLSVKKLRMSADGKYGSSWLTDYINKQCALELEATTVRSLLRQMVQQGVLDRAMGNNKSRYYFTGPDDPIVQTLVDTLNSGNLGLEDEG